MIELARFTARAARFLQASLYAVELPPCVAVTAIGEGLNYSSSEDPREELPKLFARIAEALSPGGLLIFDTVLRSERRRLCYQSTREGPEWRIVVDVNENPEESVLTRRIITVREVAGKKRRSEEVHRVRTFSRSELE